MNSLIALALRRSRWRGIACALALAGALGFAFEPYLVLAQTPAADAPVVAPPKAKAPAKPASRKAHRHTPTDFVSDDLNRRESERASQLVHDMSAGAPSAGGGNAVAPPAAPVAGTAATTPIAPPAAASKSAEAEPPTISAIPPRAAIVSASLTPDVTTPQPGDQLSPSIQTTAPAPSQPITPQPRQMAQAQPPAPAPVPIQPPAAPSAPGGAANPPSVIAGAPGRAFGQVQQVPTQQPTLRLEINKGTAIRLPGPASTVFVAAPDIADVQVKSPTMIYVFAKKAGDTVLYAVDDHDRVLLNTIVSVTSPLSRIKGQLDAIHPGNEVMFDNQSESIVLSGTVRSAQVAEDARRLALQHVGGAASKVINNIRVEAPNQVQLRVKVAEVRRDALKRVGINWQNINNIALFSLGAGLLGLSGGAAVQTIQSTGGTGSGAIQLTNQLGFNALIDFLATNNMATVLAEPNLVAMSGETASFLAGGEIPIIAPQAGLTGSTFSIAYKQVGVSLSFTPTIIDDRINLKVSPEVSQLSSTGSISVPLTSTAVVTVPAVQTRRASTTIELASGQSFAIAGLLQQTSQQDIVKLPWLGDLPILGTLFKSDAYQRSESELVIIITPYLVEPTSGHLRTPLTGRVPPTDADRLVYQRFNNPTPPQRVPVGGAVTYTSPSAGFKLD